MIEHNMFSRLEAIFNSYQSPLSREQIKEIEELDTLRERGMLLAERGCRQLRVGGALHWSPKLQRAMDKIRYIKLTIPRKKGCKVGATVLIRLSKQLGMKTEYKSIAQLEKELVSAYKEFKVFKRTHHKERLTFLEDLAEAIETQEEVQKQHISEL